MAKSSRIAVGVDIIEIERIEQAISNWHDSFLERIYTESELENCRYVSSRLATRFAAKEAVMKAFGTGMHHIKWREIEVTLNSCGAPNIKLHGRARNKAKELGIADLSVSLSHSKQYAIAMVVGYAS